jgi:hypothetical protein
MQETQHRSFQAPDETRAFPNGRAEIVKIGDGEVGRLVFEPGWRWSNDVKAIAQTNSLRRPISNTSSLWTGSAQPITRSKARPGRFVRDGLEVL